MAVYRDIDTSVRIGGSLTLPSGSISLGTGIITLGGNKLIFSNTHSLNKISLLDSNGVQTIGTEANQIAYGNHSVSTTDKVGHKFYAGSNELIAQIGFGGSGTPANRIDAYFAGNTGIGISPSPVYRLIVKGTNTNGLDTLQVQNSAGNSMQFGVSTTGAFIDSQATHNLHLRTNGIDRVNVLNTNGNVGIGITAPTYKLDVNGDVNIATGSAFRINGVNIDSLYLKSGATDKYVGTNFSVQGALYLGTNANPYSSGDLFVYDATGGAKIHIDGDSSGNTNSSNVYLAGNGKATFADEVTVKRIKMTDTTKPLIKYLNAEYLNGLGESEFSKTKTVLDMAGYGVITGLLFSIYSSNEVNLNPVQGATVSIAYTQSGKRKEYGIPGTDPNARVTIPSNTATTPGGETDENYTKYYVVYIKGPSQGVTEGDIAFLGGNLAQLPETIDIGDGIKLYYIRRRPGAASIIGSDVTDMRDIRPVILDNTNLTIHSNRNLIVQGSIKESGSFLVDKYARLNVSNTYVGNQDITGRVKITSSGEGAGNYYLQTTDGTDTLSLTAKELIVNNHLLINAGDGAKDISLLGKVKAPKNATTLTIPAGQTSVTWTHNQGSTSYAVNISLNSFARHVKWSNKTANTIAIQIDDSYDEDVLVDCILIGY